MSVQTLTTEELAEMLHTSAETIRRMRRRGHGPPYIVLAGGHVRYYRPAVDEWIAAGGNRAAAEGWNNANAK